MQEVDQIALQNGVILFRDVYHSDISVATFSRKHFENPECLPTPYIIEYKKESPVAMRWMMKEIFTCNGEEMPAVQSADDAVLPEARGLLFLKMRKKSVNMMLENNIDFEYGCFAQGEAMEIAEKTGETNVVNLYLARMLLQEKTHRWKRFDIKYPKLYSNILFKSRKKKLEKLDDGNCDIKVTDFVEFSAKDYDLLNAGDNIKIKRSEAYYRWKIAGIENIKVVTARKNDELKGFLIVKTDGDKKTIADWDVFGENKPSVLAAMMLKICEGCQYIDIPSLNMENGEMDLFTGIGAKDMSRLWACTCICVKPLNETLRFDIMKGELWKHRLIDADFFMN